MDEEYTLKNCSDHDRVMKIINDRKKPNGVLRLMMNAFEGYRQSRKLGWSRPWNKHDLTNFQSFRVRKERDQDLMVLADRIINQECIGITGQALEFADTLINRCDSLMAFIFVHDYMDQGQLYEGATLSLGRKNNKRYRDRLDIIVESPIVAGESQGFKRLRVYIDPYTGEKAPLWSDAFWATKGPSIELFDRLSKISHDWQSKKENHWNHWTSDYIDYFGPRQEYIQNSFFYQDVVVPSAHSSAYS